MIESNGSQWIQLFNDDNAAWIAYSLRWACALIIIIRTNPISYESDSVENSISLLFSSHIWKISFDQIEISIWRRTSVHIIFDSMTYQNLFWSLRSPSCNTLQYYAELKERLKWSICVVKVVIDTRRRCSVRTPSAYYQDQSRRADVWDMTRGRIRILSNIRQDSVRMYKD